MIRGFSLRMAARDLRTAGRRLTLFVLSISIGVAAIIAVGGFRANVLSGLRNQGRVLLGADLELESRFAFPEEVISVLDSIAATEGAAWAPVTTVPTMVAAERTGKTALLALRALDVSYPFYGSIETVPAGVWEELGAGRSSEGAVAEVLAERGALTRLGAEVGDTLAIGELRAVVRGEVSKIPGDPGIRSAVNPRIYLPASDLGRTQLIRAGSLATYRAYVRVADRRAAFRFVRRYRPLLARHSIAWDTAAERERDLARAFDAVGRFLGLVGLAALLLGAIGVASAMHIYVRQRQVSASVLRCLGSTGRTLVQIYVLQALMLSLVGAGIGVGLGLGLQAILPRVVADLLPLEFEYRVEPGAVAAGVLAGVWTATLFAWHAIVPLRWVPALGAIRRAALGSEAAGTGYRETHRGERPVRVLISATVIGLCVWQAGALGPGLAFAAGVGLALLALSAVARALIALTRRSAPRGAPFPVRQGISNLFRPQNQTCAAIMALGFAVFLIGTIAAVERNVQRRFSLAAGGIEANLAVFDVPSARTEDVRRMLSEAGHPALDVVPVIPARLHAVKGDLVADMLERWGRRRRGRRGGGREQVRPAEAQDSLEAPAGGSLWALRREYRNSVRDTLVEGEEIVAGAWWGGSDPAAASDPILRVSLETEVARALRVGVGDTITWDFQGRTVDSEIASIRAVDWTRLAPNFVALFKPGTVAGIPRTDLILTRIDDDDARARFQDRVATSLPAVLVIDLTSIQAAIGDILERASLATRFMGAFTLIAGLLILAATVVAARGLRLRENALLRALGARSGTLRGILMTEFLVLGSLAGLAGVLLAAVSSWALMRWVFALPFSLPIGLLGSLWAGASLLTLVLGMLGSRAVVRPHPLVAIRRAGEVG